MKKLNYVTIGIVALAGYAAYKMFMSKTATMKGLEGPHGGGGGGHGGGGHWGGGHGGGWRGGYGGSWYGPGYYDPYFFDPLVVTTVPGLDQRSCIEMGGTYQCDASGCQCGTNVNSQISEGLDGLAAYRKRASGISPKDYCESHNGQWQCTRGVGCECTHV